jgi:adenine deaminase
MEAALIRHGAVTIFLSPERLMMICEKQGIEAFIEEIHRLKRLHLI